LPEEISKSINDNGIIRAAVLSGNRNFRSRVSPDGRPIIWRRRRCGGLCAGGYVTKNLAVEPIGNGKDGKPVI